MRANVDVGGGVLESACVCAGACVLVQLCVCVCVCVFVCVCVLVFAGTYRRIANVGIKYMGLVVPDTRGNEAMRVDVEHVLLSLAALLDSGTRV